MGLKIDIGEWLPDLPSFSNPGALRATNVVPEAVSYTPFPNLNVISNALGGRCQGAILARDSAGNNYNYAGDASALYRQVAGTYTAATRLVGGAYATQSADFWEMVQFNETIITVNGKNADAPQTISLGAANFAALGGAPPKASHIAAVRDFIVMGNISDTTAQANRVRWCAINNPASWTPDAATLADFQDLPAEDGFIQKVIGGEYGVILQERAITRMTFVGSPAVFQFDRIQRAIGEYAPQAAVAYQNLTFFLSRDGFYVFDGSAVKPIGRGKVDNTFFNDLDTTAYQRIFAAINPSRKLVLWAYPASGNTGGNPNRILLYSWAYDRFARVEDVNIQLITQSVTTGYDLDTTFNASDSVLDVVSGPSFDDEFWQGGQLILSAFNASNQLATFDGSAMAATVDTREIQPYEGYRAQVTEVRPYIEGLSASAQIAVSTRNVLTESASFGTAVSPNATGFVPLRANGRYLRFRITTTNNTDFDHIFGVEAEVQREGVR